MLKGLALMASDTDALEVNLKEEGIPFKKISPGSKAEALRDAAGKLGETSELLCLVETDADEKKALAEGLACIGYLNPNRPEERLSGCQILLEGFEEVDGTFLREVHRRAKGLPVTIAETERLLIREMALSDLSDVNILCLRNGLPAMEENEAKSYIEHMYGFYRCGLWLVFEKKSGKLIGRCGFGIADYLEEAELDLGYLIDRDFRRQGYAQEAVRAVLSYGRERLDLTKIAAYVQEENEASRGLLFKLGFDAERIFSYNGKKIIRYEGI